MIDFETLREFGITLSRPSPASETIETVERDEDADAIRREMSDIDAHGQHERFSCR